jgi:hypothetical protein
MKLDDIFVRFGVAVSMDLDVSVLDKNFPVNRRTSMTRSSFVRTFSSLKRNVCAKLFSSF